MKIMTLLRASAVVAALSGCSAIKEAPTDVCKQVAAIEMNPKLMAVLLQVDPHSAIGVLWSDLVAACPGGVPAPGVSLAWLIGIFEKFLAAAPWAEQ